MSKHKHHIIPKHMGGTDDPNNIIELSVSDHAEAHRILFEKYGKKEDKFAWLGLSSQIGQEEIWMERSSIGGENNKGISKSSEHRRKISEALRGSRGSRIPMSEERKINISKAMMGNKSSKGHSSPEYKKTQSEAMKAAWVKRKQRKGTLEAFL